MIHDTVAYLKSKRKKIFFDAEHFFDGFHHNPDYALSTVVTAQEAGADAIILCDTNGGTLTDDLMRIIMEVFSADFDKEPAIEHNLLDYLHKQQGQV